jgi:hypothetical protein
VDSPKRAPPNLILDYVLIDTMFCLPILLIISILRFRIECLLDFSMRRGTASVVPDRTLVGGGRAVSRNEPLLSTSTPIEVNVQSLNYRWSNCLRNSWDIQRDAYIRLLIRSAKRRAWMVLPCEGRIPALASLSVISPGWPGISQPAAREFKFGSILPLPAFSARS